MPYLETWPRLPAAVRDHLVEPMHERIIGLEDLNRLRVWVQSKPEVPEAPWYKDFGSFLRRRQVSQNIPLGGPDGCRAETSD